MFTQSLPTSRALEAGLFHAEAHGGGHVLQTWPALGNGQHDAYSSAAHALGLGCLWDLQSPTIERAPAERQ